MSKKIPLTHGLFALIDDADFELVSQYRWCAHGHGHTWYAETNVRIAPGRGKGTFRVVKMHRLILGAVAGQQVDHINGDGLNNLRNNIRLCTKTENSRNTRRGVRNTSGYKGVVWHKASSSWVAQISLTTNGKRKGIHLGCYESKEEAARAYDLVAKDLYGEFARLNFPDKK